MHYETTLERANKLAEAIRHETIGLDNEGKSAVTPGTGGARALKYRDRDRAKINGMRIALSYLLGVPLHMQLTDAFIEGKPEFRALLPEELREEFGVA